MKIAEFRVRINPQKSRGGFLPIADFALDVTPDFRMTGLQLIEAPDGAYVLSIPRHNDWPVASMAPNYKKEIIANALDTFNESNHAAA